MPYPGLLHPEPPPLRQATVDRTSAGDTQTQFWLNLCGVSGSWCTQGLFEPSEHLWQEWGLILNVNLHPHHLAWASPLPLDVGYLLKVAPASCNRHSSAYHFAGASLTLEGRYLLMAAPAPCSHPSSCLEIVWLLNIMLDEA